jgi:hypothetical protein
MPNHTRAVLRAAVTVTSVAAAIASAGAATAHAAGDGNDLKAAAAGSHQAGQALVGTVKYLPINPLAHTRVNPLDNSLGSQVADFKPVSTAMVTGPLSDSRTVSELPLIGSTVKKLQAG